MYFQVLFVDRTRLQMNFIFSYLKSFQQNQYKISKQKKIKTAFWGQKAHILIYLKQCDADVTRSIFSTILTIDTP